MSGYWLGLAPWFAGGAAWELIVVPWSYPRLPPRGHPYNPGQSAAAWALSLSVVWALHAPAQVGAMQTGALACALFRWWWDDDDRRDKRRQVRESITAKLAELIDAVRGWELHPQPAGSGA